jgi:hypothetical protein
MAISDKEIALIARTADSFRKAAIAARESRAGELVAQRNVTVSRRIRIQRRSKKASSSWSVIGFHQLGSWIMILPLRVAGSPSSTALNELGKLIFGLCNADFPDPATIWATKSVIPGIAH